MRSLGGGDSGAMLDGMIWTLLLYWSSASWIFDVEATDAGGLLTGLEDTWMMVMLVDPLLSLLAVDVLTVDADAICSDGAEMDGVEGGASAVTNILLGLRFAGVLSRAELRFVCGLVRRKY